MPIGEEKSRSGLDVVQLSKTYSGAPAAAVDEITFSVGDGEFLALLGSSGSGKSTTLAMIAGLTEPTSGDIRIGGESLLGVPPEERDIGIVFQSYALFPHMTVSANIAYPLRMRRMKRADVSSRVADAIELVGLSGLADRFPSQLSGGQQQRVALARALVFQPPILLMDEPLGALDKQLRGDMQREIHKIHHETGVTIVYVTHDQYEALSLADRIAVMKDGRIEQIDSPTALYRNPLNRFVGSFIGECNLLKLERAERNADGWSVQLGGIRGKVQGPGPTAGEDACLMVRPHHLRIVEPGNGSLPARVVAALYQGSETEVTVEAAGGEKVVVRLPDGEVPADVGAGVGLEWDWSAARVV